MPPAPREGSQDLHDVLAVSWFEHRRTRELCAGLNVELALLATTHRGLLRYLLLTGRTLALLARRRPRALLVQSPSLVLSVLAVALRSVLGYRLFVDAHNESVVPYKNRQPWIRSLSRWVIRRADLTIVSNRQLADIVRAHGGRAFVLPDRIPAPPPSTGASGGAGFNVVLIATFDDDEPIAAVFAAVQGAPLKLFVTGNPRKARMDVASQAPPNVQFTGFLADGDYWALLRAADAIIDLTLKPDCLVCGAYEALALAKPVLLSDNTAGVELFGDGVLFTDNSPADIRRALTHMQAERAALCVAAEHKRDELIERWQAVAHELGCELTSASGEARPLRA
jgi:glycosyltransferase involved in cell wall biosynthesis